MAAFSGDAAPVNLGRVFTLGEKYSYSIRASLHAETRSRGLQTWIPDDLDLNYDFTAEVTAMQTDGIAVLHYLRPTITQIDGETFDRGPVTTKEKINWDLLLTVSPYNEVIAVKDQTKKPPKKKSAAMYVKLPARPQVGQIIGQFVGEVQRLALFVGSFESSLDFAPRTPFNAVKVGDTWKRTVGYQPQKLKGKDGKQAVQRLDFTYTYKGVVNTNKGPVLRVEAQLDFANDLAEFINQLVDANSDTTGLKSIPLNLKSTILFDLDPKTHHTLNANADTVSDYKIVLTDDPNDPVQEQKMRGKTRLWLVSKTKVVPGKK